MNANPPLISIIMPCYNAAYVIQQTVENLYQQTEQNFELIIIDDGSTDQSLLVVNELSEHYPNLIIISQENRGPGPARNRGIKQARGEFIAFLDADDSWHPKCLAKLHKALINSPDCVLAYCGWQNTGLEANLCKPYIPPDYEQNDKLALLLCSCPWPIHAVLTYKSAINKVNGFNERWLTAEDFDMWLRIAAYKRIVRVPEVLAYYHHQQGEQISKNRLRTILNHWGVQKAFLLDYPDTLKTLGQTKATLITDGKLLDSGYAHYWNNDLKTSHVIFRKLIRLGNLRLSNLKHLLPALLPFCMYKLLINILRS